MPQMPIYFGDFEVKSNDDGQISGWIVRYGNPMVPDASKMRDFFTKATDFDLEDGDRKSVLHEHGMSPDYGQAAIASLKASFREDGIWGEGLLKKSIIKRDALIADIKNGEYGFSSGSQGYRVEREKQPNNTHYVKRWPIGEVSLTKNPAEPRAHAFCIKSLLVPDIAEEIASDTKTSVGISVSDYDYETGNSTNLSQAVHADDPTEMMGRLSELQNVLQLFLTALNEGSPAAKSKAMDAYMKVGAAISKTNQTKLKSMHDLICQIWPSACPADQSMKSVSNGLVDAALISQLAANQITIKSLADQLDTAKKDAPASVPADLTSDSIKTLIATAIEEKVAEIETLKTELETAKKSLALSESLIKGSFATPLPPKGKAAKR